MYISAAGTAVVSQRKERTQRVFNVVRQVANGTIGPTFRPADVVQALRDSGFPMGTWEVRGELSQLERSGMIEFDTGTGLWALTQAGSETQKLSWT